MTRCISPFLNADMRGTPPTMHEEELFQFAHELVRGSANIQIHRRVSDYRDILQHRFRVPDIDSVINEVNERFPIDPATMWQIGRTSVQTAESNRRPNEQPEISFSEFLGGIAVACDIHPAQSDIDTAIFMLGIEIGKLEMGNIHG